MKIVKSPILLTCYFFESLIVACFRLSDVFVDIHLKIPHIAIKKGTTLAAFKNKREVSFYQFSS